MDKTSSAQLMEVLADAATTLRSQRDTIHDLQDKLASRDRRDRVEKIAGAMHSKNLELDTPIDVLADRLEKMAEATPEKLDAFEQGVELVAPDMGMKVASLTDDNKSGSGMSDFERFITIGHVG